MADFEAFVDYQDRAIRLTSERWAHILDHPEMVGQRDRMIETLAAPDVVIATMKDETIHAYHRLYERTPVTRKFMVVVVKKETTDAFVVTAYYAGRLKKGKIVWPL